MKNQETKFSHFVPEEKQALRNIPNEKIKSTEFWKSRVWVSNIEGKKISTLSETVEWKKKKHEKGRELGIKKVD